ncbi:hypothetical protein [Paenibacillus sp. R14(2021)]|uniref:hypothetical protein n=1 Tax=Paenibacillus sp. R14(2021) TaxID=2859228 RepID=UPI0021585A2D|nr:hypothetical protein [Paenibacillus sp. R14(2021)]
MKFKQSEVQNQRIERISTSHLIVGIDMAKETLVAQATNYRGIGLTNRHLSFSNTIEGFEKLQRWMEGIQQKHRLGNVIIGMERQVFIGGTWPTGLQVKRCKLS